MKLKDIKVGMKVLVKKKIDARHYYNKDTKGMKKVGKNCSENNGFYSMDKFPSKPVTIVQIEKNDGWKEVMTESNGWYSHKDLKKVNMIDLFTVTLMAVILISVATIYSLLEDK